MNEDFKIGTIVGFVIGTGLNLCVFVGFEILKYNNDKNKRNFMYNCATEVQYIQECLQEWKQEQELERKIEEVL